VYYSGCDCFPGTADAIAVCDAETQVASFPEEPSRPGFEASRRRGHWLRLRFPRGSCPGVMARWARIVRAYRRVGNGSLLRLL
jgi:hypothetical protein